MTSAVEKDGSRNMLVQASYVYDPFGNRVEETVTDGSGTTVTRYAYDAQGQTLWQRLTVRATSRLATSTGRSRPVVRRSARWRDRVAVDRQPRLDARHRG